MPCIVGAGLSKLNESWPMFMAQSCALVLYVWWLTVHVEMVAMHASACINACVHSAIKDYEMTAYSRSAGGSGGGGGGIKRGGGGGGGGATTVEWEVEVGTLGGKLK